MTYPLGHNRGPIDIAAGRAVLALKLGEMARPTARSMAWCVRGGAGIFIEKRSTAHEVFARTPGDFRRADRGYPDDCRVRCEASGARRDSGRPAQFGKYLPNLRKTTRREIHAIGAVDRQSPILARPYDHWRQGHHRGRFQRHLASERKRHDGAGGPFWQARGLPVQRRGFHPRASSKTYAPNSGARGGKRLVVWRRTSLRGVGPTNLLWQSYRRNSHRVRCRRV